MIKKVILVFKTHFDIGFTDLAENVIKQYAGPMLDEVLETCRATENMGKLRYVWTMPAWPLKVIVENCGGKRKAKLEHFIRNGQLVWHALPFTSHTDFCGEEEYLKSLSYAKELSEKFQKPYPIAAKMTDVPGHGLMLPEILAAANIRFLHLGCNAFATPPKVPDLFYWRAPSGRKVLTMYGKGGYGSSLETPSGWEFPVWMALVHTHDNCGPHSAEFIRGLEQEARALYPEAEIVCGTMDDFYRELEQCDLTGIPEITQDLADTWIHGIGAYPREVSDLREMRHQSTRLQKLYRQMKEPVLSEETFQQYLNTYYENMHLFGEHTWGADVKTWLGPERVYKKEQFAAAQLEEKYRFMEQSWEEQRERAVHCRQALDRLEAAMPGNEGTDYLYNPSLQPYTGWAKIEKVNVKGRHHLSGAGRKNLLSSEIFGEHACYVSDLKPLATTELVIQEAPEKEVRELKVNRRGALFDVENHRYRLEFDPQTGKIVRLTDKQNNCVLLEEQAGIGVFSYQYTRHGIQKMTEFLRSYGYRYSTWGIQDYGREAYPECEDVSDTPAFCETAVSGDTISFIYAGGNSAEKYGNAKEIRLNITLPPVGEELFVEFELIGKQATAYLESGSICMPLPKGEREYYMNKNGSVLNPKTDIAEQANHVYYAIEEFTASDDGRHGVCIMPKDTPLVSIGEDGMYLYRKSYEEREGILFFNTFNNMWGTNFPQWQSGDYRYRFVIWGYRAEERKHLYMRSLQLAEGVLTVPERVCVSDVQLPESLQLLNIVKAKEDVIYVTRDLTGETNTECVQADGYLIEEVDWFGRVLGEGQKDEYLFEKLKYGLHLFRFTNCGN